MASTAPNSRATTPSGGGPRGSGTASVAATAPRAPARAELLLGRTEESEQLVGDVLQQVGEEAPLLAAEAHLQLGEAALARGHVAAARTGFQQAVMRLSAVGADRQAAQLWFDLGAHLEQVDQSALALDAYRRAAAAAGLRWQRPSSVGAEAER